MSTITVRGEGGAVFDMDVPAEGTVRREVFDDALAKGRLVILSGDVPAEGAVLPDPTDKVAVWRAYAVSVDPDNADAIAKMAKPALIERYTPNEPEDEQASQEPTPGEEPA